MTNQEILAQFGEKIVERLREAIRERPVTRFGAVNASGELQESVRFQVDERGLKIWAKDYIYYLEQGRKPGKFPPPDAIKKWIEDKRLTFDIPIDSLAFLIGRKIAQQGTTAWEQGGTDLVASVINEALFNEIKNSLLGALKFEVTSELLKAYGKAA